MACGVGGMVRSQIGVHSDVRSMCLPESLGVKFGSRAALTLMAGIHATAIVQAVTRVDTFGTACGDFGG